MNKTNREKEAVLNVFAALVRPLMRVAFEYGISAGEIAGVVRRVYIQALEARLQEQKRPTTDARIAAVAGLTRSDVSALRDALRAGAPHSLRAAVTNEQMGIVLTVWHTNSAFSGAYGLAMDLDIHSVPGSPHRTFKELVDVACPGVDQDMLLDELIATRAVEVIDGITIRCLSRAAHVPRGVDVMRIERMGRFLGVATQNFVHNLLRTESEPSYFDSAVISDEVLSDDSRDKFLAVAGERGRELLAELDTFLTRLGTSEQVGSGKKYGVGIYFFEEEAANDAVEHHPKESRVPASGGKTTAIEEIDVLAPRRKKD